MPYGPYVFRRPPHRIPAQRWVPTKELFVGPGGIATGLEVWFKADAITGLSDGDPVATWEDSSPANNDATQGTGGNQPLYQTNEQNGLPGVQFDGTDDFLTVAGIVNNDNTRTVFCVAEATALGNRRVWCLGGANLASIRAVDATNWDYSVNNGSAVVNLGGEPQTTDVFVVKYTSTASADAYMNGGSAINFDPHDGYTGGSSALTLGAQATAATPFAGFIYEFIVYDSALSDADRETVRDYLVAKWFPVSATKQLAALGVG